MLCLQCNNETRNPKFCNHSCAAIYHNKNLPPEKRRMKEGRCNDCGSPIKKQSKKCNECWARLKKKPNQCLWCSKDTKNSKFCSHVCACKYSHKYVWQTETKPKILPKLKYFCSDCGKKVRKSSCKCIVCFNKSKHNETLSKTLGSYNHLGIFAKHAKIRVLSRKWYRVANLPKCCHICGYNKHYEVCHIRPIKNFPDTATLAEVNHLDNLIALCPNCHWEFDKGLISPTYG